MRQAAPGGILPSSFLYDKQGFLIKYQSFYALFQMVIWQEEFLNRVRTRDNAIANYGHGMGAAVVRLHPRPVR